MHTAQTVANTVMSSRYLSRSCKQLGGWREPEGVFAQPQLDSLSDKNQIDNMQYAYAAFK